MLSLADAEIHLWQAEIVAILPVALVSQLDEPEQAFLAKIGSAKASHEFLVSRWSTRQILSRYGSISAEKLQFQTSPEGKPSLLSDSAIAFNRSHSCGWWVLAVSRCPQIGVDIEKTVRQRPFQEIVERWFTPEEQECFRATPEAARKAYFYACWTQKEAVLKAAGLGLSHLDKYSSLETHYFKQHFSPAPDFAGCVAQKKTGDRFPKITCFSFHG